MCFEVSEDFQMRTSAKRCLRESGFGKCSLRLHHTQKLLPVLLLLGR